MRTLILGIENDCSDTARDVVKRHRVAVLEDPREKDEREERHGDVRWQSVFMSVAGSHIGEGSEKMGAYR